jgi:amidohydrolase
MKKLIAGVLFTVLASVPVFAEQGKQQDGQLSSAQVAQFEAVIDTDANRLIEIFKDIHQNPELGFMEERTAAIVAKELGALGYDVKTGIGGTGVVGVMKNGDGPVVMYRADMDANAAEEKTGLPYASTRRVANREGVEVPVAHLCGHDAHTTWLLALATVMAQMKDSWSGTLVLVAQPAEELIEGATAMLNDGLYTEHKVPRPDYLIAMHTAPVPTGIVVSPGGVMMAGTEQLDVTIYGQSSHGSAPQFSKDAGLMAAYAVVQYQAITARVLDPRDPAVITVGAINAGVENNTIPGEAELKLNFRFFDEDVRAQLYTGVKAVSEGIARTYGMPEDKMPTIVRKGYSSALVNDDDLAGHIAQHLVDTGTVSPENMITEFRAVTGSEDAHMLVHGNDDVKVGFLFVGTASPEVMEQARQAGKTVPFANHQSTYQVDLEAIPYGSKVATAVVLDLLAK